MTAGRVDSRVCHSCNLLHKNDKGKWLQCSVCKLALYGNNTCVEAHQKTHAIVCEAIQNVRQEQDPHRRNESAIALAKRLFTYTDPIFDPRMAVLFFNTVRPLYPSDPYSREEVVAECLGMLVTGLDNNVPSVDAAYSHLESIIEKSTSVFKKMSKDQVIEKKMYEYIFLQLLDAMKTAASVHLLHGQGGKHYFAAYQRFFF